MGKTENFLFINKELDEQLKKRIESLVLVCIIKNRKRWILNYLGQNLTKFMGEDRLLTSDEVMDMLQIDRKSTRLNSSH